MVNMDVTVCNALTFGDMTSQVRTSSPTADWLNRGSIRYMLFVPRSSCIFTAPSSSGSSRPYAQISRMVSL